MGLLTTECLHEETAIDRRALWTTDELDSLVEGLLREPQSEEADPLSCSEQGAPVESGRPKARAPDRWFALEWCMFWAFVTHET